MTAVFEKHRTKQNKNMEAVWLEQIKGGKETETRSEKRQMRSHGVRKQLYGLGP